MTQLQLIDLAPFYQGGAEGRRRVAQAVDRACRELGFFIVVGHQVPAELVASTRSVARDFFGLPLADKLKARTPDLSSGRGYVPVEGETLSSTTTFQAPPDLKETFSIGPFEISDDPYYLYEPSGVAFSPNVWPPALPALEEAMTGYYRALGALAADLLRMAALAFGLPEDWFETRNDRPTSALRVLHYPSDGGLRGGQFPASPHTDYGTWTILNKRPGPTGLQVQSVDGSWVDVDVPEHAFVVNTGDLMMRWSGGHWLSTLHQVVPITDSDPDGELSMAFFHQPNWDVMVYPWVKVPAERPELAQRYGSGAAERNYFGVPVGEFVFGKYRASVAADPLAQAEAGQAAETPGEK